MNRIKSKMMFPSYERVLENVYNLNIEVKDLLDDKKAFAFLEKNSIILYPLFCRHYNGFNIGYMLIHPGLNGKFDMPSSIVTDRIRRLGYIQFPDVFEYEKALDEILVKYQTVWKINKNENKIEQVSYEGDIILCLYP